MIACNLMRAVLQRRLTRLGDMAASSVANSGPVSIGAPAPTSQPTPVSTHATSR
jgi:hypothetical protein